MKRVALFALLLLLPALLLRTSAQERYFLYGGGSYPAGQNVVLSTWFDDRPGTELRLYRIENPAQILALGGPQSFEATAELDLTELRTIAVSPGGQGRMSNIDLGVLPIGMYFAELGPAGASTATIVLVTDLALVVKGDEDGLLAYTADLFGGEPRAATVHIGVGPEAYPVDSDGLLHVEEPPGNGGNRLVAAQDGDSWAFTELWWSAWATDRPTAYMVTDRPVYRPGQAVHFSGVARLSRSVAPLAGEEVEVVVIDADYEEILRETFTTDDYGGFAGELLLGAGAPLGYYDVEVWTQGALSWSHFWVEEYQLPEYEVTASADVPYAIQGDTASFTVEAEYLFGGPVGGATVDWVLMAQEFSPFAWRSEYGFYDDYSFTWGGNVIARGEATLDADGRAVIPATLPAYDYDYRLTLQAGVSDESGRQISATASMVGYRADLALGARSERYAHPLGEDIEITVSAVDLEGNPVSTDFELATFRYWWQQGVGEQRESGPTYSGTTGADGQATVTIRPDQAGSWRVQVSASDDQGRNTDAWSSLWIYGDTGWYWNYQNLTVEPDKPEYQVGETARFVIQSPVADGYALVTREGGRLGSWELVRFEGNSFTYELEVTNEDLPNGHLGVVVVGDGETYTNVAEYRIDPGERFLNVEIVSDSDVYEPGASGEFTLRVSDHTGAGVPARVTLALVDEAVFLIRPDHIQDIRPYFYAWRSNSVYTGISSFAYFGFATPVGEARAPMDEAVFGQAKDMDAARGALEEFEDPRLREDFRETALWLPAVETGEDGLATISVDFPDNLTRWRLTARAVTDGNQVGQDTYNVTTTLPVLARLAMPNFLVRGDETQLRVIGQSSLDEAVTAQLGLTADGLTLTGDPATRRAELTPGTRVTADWRAIADQVGTASVTAEVLSSVASDALRLELPVIPHGIREEITQSGQGQGTWSFMIPEAFVPGSVEGQLTLTPSFAAAVTPALAYLAGYPFGCTEQTMSRFLPSVLASSSGYASLLPEDVRDDLDDFVQTGLAYLYRFQHADGGWGFWQYDVSNPSITAYVVTGLLQARAAGYEVSESALARALDYLEGAAAREAFQVHDDLEGAERRTATADAKAYVWYALALAGRDADALSEVAGSPDLSNHGLALAVLAFEAAGQTVEAQLHLDELLSRITEREAVAFWEAEAPRYTWSDDRVEATALALQALARLRPDAPVIPKIVSWLLLERQGARWLSTKDTAAVVVAAIALEEALPAATGAENVVVMWDDGMIDEVVVDTASVTIDLSAFPSLGPNVIAVDAPADSTLYWSASLSYVAEGDFPEPDDSAGLGVTRVYEQLTPVWVEDEGRIVYERSPLGQSEVGDFVLVSVTLEPQGNYRYVLVNEPIPAGFAVVEDDRPFRISGIAPRYGEGYFGWNYWYDGRQVRDQRVDYYFARLVEPVTFTYILRAEIPGEFTALPSQAWLMYEPDVQGRSAQERLLVVPEGGE